jgi:hypothetical protein
MRGMLYAAIAVGLCGLASGTTRADEQGEIKALIEKAITAQGGREKLTKFKAFTMKLKGKGNAQGMAFDFTMDLKVQEPDKSKFSMDLEIAGQKLNVAEVVNGDMGWTKSPATNQVEAMSKEQMAEHKEQSHSRRIESLIVLTGKEFKLAPLGESKIGDTDVVGIRVSSAGHRDVSLYFDKQSSLLLKSESMVKDPMLGDKEIAQESIYSDYKEVDGMKYAAKMTMKRDGMEFMNGEVTEWTPAEKIDDSEFAKP